MQRERGERESPEQTSIRRDQEKFGREMLASRDALVPFLTSLSSVRSGTQPSKHSRIPSSFNSATGREQPDARVAPPNPTLASSVQRVTRCTASLWEQRVGRDLQEDPQAVLLCKGKMEKGTQRRMARQKGKHCIQCH